MEKLNSSKFLSGFVKALSTVEERIDRVLEISSPAGKNEEKQKEKENVTQETSQPVSTQQWGNMFEWDGTGITSFVTAKKKDENRNKSAENVNVTNNAAVVKENVQDKTLENKAATSENDSVNASYEKVSVKTEGSALNDEVKSMSDSDKEQVEITNKETINNNLIPRQLVQDIITEAIAVSTVESRKTSTMSELFNEENQNFVTEKEKSSVTPVSSYVDNFSNVLSQREAQLMNVMKENSRLVEENENLKQALELLRKRTDVGESVKPQSELQKDLDAKDAQVQQLMEEGRKLSELNGKLRDAAKKLKAKESEASKALEQLQEKFVTLKNETASQKETISQLEERGRQYTSSLKIQSEANEQNLAKIKRLEEDLKEKQQQINSVQQLLEKSMEEASILKKDRDTNNFNLKSELLEKNVKTINELKEKLDEALKSREDEKISFEKTISSLRSTLSRTENEIGWKEDRHRKEILSYQQRLQDAEARNEEIASSIQDSAKPFVRQINALKDQQVQSQQMFEQMEKGMREKLASLEAEKSSALSRLKHNEDMVLVLQAKLKHAEDHSQRDKLAAASLSDQLSKERESALELKTKLTSLENKLKSFQSRRQSEIDEAKSHMEKLIRQQVQDENQELIDKARDLENALLEKDKELERFKAKILSDAEKSPTSQTSRRGSNINSPTATLFDNFHFNSRLSSFENQISTLQVQLQQVTQQKGNILFFKPYPLDQLSAYLVELTKENNRLKETASSADLQKELEEMRLRYKATLELLGEKTELVDELKQDIDDMRKAYKEQIQDLISQISNITNK